MLLQYTCNLARIDLAADVYVAMDRPNYPVVAPNQEPSIRQIASDSFVKTQQQDKIKILCSFLNNGIIKFIEEA